MSPSKPALPAIVVLALALAAGAASPIFAQEKQHVPAGVAPPAEQAWSLEAGVEANSIYLFRGVDLLAGDGVLVPNAAFTWKGLAIWAESYAGSIPEVGGTYRENDVGIDYTFTIGRAVVTVGALAYLYNGAVEEKLGYENTREIHAGVELEALLSPSLSYYHDFQAIDGGYLTFALGHAFELGENVALDLSGAVSFDFGYNKSDAWAAENGGRASNGELDDALVAADLAWQVSEPLSAHLLVQHSFALDALEDLGEGDATNVCAGLTYTF